MFCQFYVRGTGKPLAACLLIKKKKKTLYKAKKINPMSQSCRVHLFFGARLIQQNSRFEFYFACLIFFSSLFYELACQNIQEKI